MRALVTGGAGFIGLSLVKKLVDTGIEVDLIENFARGVKDEQLDTLVRERGVGILERDLTLPDSVAGLRTDYDFIFHFAAIIGVANVLRRPYSVLTDNVSMHTHLLSLARSQTKLKRFVFASTSEVYAGTLQHFDLPIPTPETTPLALPGLDHPRTSYMLSKIYGEALCQHSGVPFTVVRPHNVYGPRMGLSHVIPELMLKIHRAQPGETLEVGSPEHRRTFCFIDDAVEMIARVAQAENCRNEVLNLGTESPEVTMMDLARQISDVLGKRVELRAGPVTPGSPARRCPDMSKMYDRVGYRSSVSLNEGLKRSHAWYRNVFEQGRLSAT